MAILRITTFIWQPFDGTIPVISFRFGSGFYGSRLSTHLSNIQFISDLSISSGARGKSRKRRANVSALASQYFVPGKSLIRHIKQVH